MLLENEVGREITSWSVELGDGDLALIRYTQYIDEDAPLPDADGARRGRRRDGARLGAGGRGRADRRSRRAARDAPCADLHQQLSRRLSRAHRARGRRRRHPAPVRPRRRERPRRAHLAARQRRARPAPPQDLSPRRRSSRCPTSCRCSRISASACSRNSRPRSSGGNGYIHDFRVEVGAEADIDAILARAGGDRARDRQRAVRHGRGRRVQPARALCRARHAAGGLAARLVPLSAPDRQQLRPGHRRRCASPRAQRDARADRPVRRRARSGAEEARRAGRRLSPSSSTAALAKVRSIDDDRILRRLRALVEAIVRTNAFAPAAEEALAFKINCCAGPGPAARRCRGARSGSISPRVEGIHLRGGPVARGGLRWSDRRDDFRTEILGLMKAQLVKNAVIVPTGAKGGFYPKQLPPMSNRDAWLAEGTESYRIFIRSLLSVTDNLVNDKVVHPDERRHPRRRRSLFRGRRRQGHGDLLRHRQRNRARAQFLARRRLRERRLERLRPQGDGDHRQGRVDLGPAPLPRNGHRRSDATRSRSPAAATCRATCSATACCCRSRSS